MLEILAAVVVVLLVVLLLFRFISWLQWFRTELRYLNKEIVRTTGEEQERWKARKKRLLLSIIPFIGY